MNLPAIVENLCVFPSENYDFGDSATQDMGSLDQAVIALGAAQQQMQ